MNNFDRATSALVGAIVGGLLMVLAFFIWPQVIAPSPPPPSGMDGIASRAVRERISIDTRDDSYFYNGADLYFYSDDHTTQKFHVDGATGNIDAEGTLDLAGGMTASAGLDLDGQKLTIDADADTSLTADTDDRIDFEVAGADKLRITALGLVLVEQTAISVTAGAIITPTGGYQPLTSAAEVTASATTAIADGAVVGQIICLVNENASNVIHVPDAANTNLSAQADLGNDDTLCVLWDGADWLEIMQVDN